MSDERTALARRPESGIATTPSARELRPLLDRCPGCGEPYGRVERCPCCGHAYDRSRWTLDPRAQRSFLSLLFNTADGNYGLIGAASIVLLGLSFFSGVQWPFAVAAVMALMAVGVSPALLVGLRATLRWATQRQWIYDAPDHVTCVARGTRWQLDTFVRVRPTALSELTAPESLERLLPTHAMAMLERSEVLREIAPGERLPLTDPERAAARLALAIAIAKLQIAGRLRLVRGAIVTEHEQDGRRSTSERALFGLVARGALAQGDPFERWVLEKVPQDMIARGEVGYREAANRMSAHTLGEWPSLEAVIAAMHDELRGDRHKVSMGRAVCAQLTARAAWAQEAPLISSEPLRYLASLANAISSAFSQAEFGKARLL